MKRKVCPNKVLWALLLAVATFGVWKIQTYTSVTEPPILYVRAAAIYEGNVDQRYLMEDEAMMWAAQSFIGKPVLMGHDWRNPDVCIGEITQVGWRWDETEKAHYLEMIFVIKDPQAIAKIKDGRFKRLSIGFMINSMECSICHEEMKYCAHSPAQVYTIHGEHVLARGYITDFTGLEVSFINVPASAPARVLECSKFPLELSESK